MDFHSKISPLFLLRKLSQNCVYMSRLSPHSQIHSGWLEIISKLWILKESNKLFTSVTTPGKLEKGKYSVVLLFCLLLLRLLKVCPVIYWVTFVCKLNIASEMF